MVRLSAKTKDDERALPSAVRGQGLLHVTRRGVRWQIVHVELHTTTEGRRVHCGILHRK